MTADAHRPSPIAHRPSPFGVHHAPWPLQPASVDLRYNSTLTAAGIEVPSIEPRVSFARRLDVVVWLPSSVGR